MEIWQSGLLHRFAKPAWVKPTKVRILHSPSMEKQKVYFTDAELLEYVPKFGNSVEEVKATIERCLNVEVRPASEYVASWLK